MQTTLAGIDLINQTECQLQLIDTLLTLAASETLA